MKKRIVLLASLLTAFSAFAQAPAEVTLTRRQRLRRPSSRTSRSSGRSNVYVVRTAPAARMSSTCVPANMKRSRRSSSDDAGYFRRRPGTAGAGADGASPPPFAREGGERSEPREGTPLPERSRPF